MASKITITATPEAAQGGASISSASEEDTTAVEPQAVVTIDRTTPPAHISAARLSAARVFSTVITVAP